MTRNLWGRHSTSIINTTTLIIPNIYIYDGSTIISDLQYYPITIVLRFFITCLHTNTLTAKLLYLCDS